MSTVRRLGGVLALLGLAACSGHAVKTTPELSKLEGKKVALVDIEGEPTARQIVEVALVNQLVKRGTFILISKQDLEAARTAPDQNPADWKGIARRAGADYALRAKVLKFDATTRSGYSEEQVEDSQLKAETGDGKTDRVYKVKSMTGDVAVDLRFTGVSGNAQGEDRSAVAEATDEVTAEGKESAAYLPPKLRFLEGLANTAFKRFFDQYE